jgi:hypothetical protein
MMWSNPAVFNKFEAADTVAKGYSIEEGVDWTVVRKTINEKQFYRPCRVFDYNYDVKAEGWVIADD